jgi:hypothetical protein
MKVQKYKSVLVQARGIEAFCCGSLTRLEGNGDKVKLEEGESGWCSHCSVRDGSTSTSEFSPSQSVSTRE